MTTLEPNQMTSNRLLLSTTEAAQVLGIGRTKVYELIAAGQLRPVHIGRSCRLAVDDLRDYVQRLRIAS